MKQDTALTSAIEKVNNILKEIEKARMAEQIVRRHEYITLTSFKDSLIELLPKERENMENCYYFGKGDTDKMFANEYFDEAFTQYTEPVKE